MVTARYPGPTNVFLPEATGQVISYSRDPKKFKVNEYVQVIKSPKPLGVYMELDRDQPARVVSDAEFAFEDGDERPSGKHNIGNFKWTEFRCFRRDYPFMLGDMTVENAQGWKPFAVQASIVAQQAMTNRTKRVVDLMETASNWGSNYATADVLNGGAGYWDKASDSEADPGYLAIKKSIDEAVLRIGLATNGIMGAEDMVLVVSPRLARKMSESPEIHHYLSHSPFALAQVRGDKANQNGTYGLPDTLYNVKIIVENAVRVSERANSSGTEATTNRSYIKSDDSAVLLSRPGGIDGQYGSPSYSTLQCYFYKWELAVESFDDRRNLRTEGHVLEAFSEKLAAAPSGWLIQDCLS